MKRKAKPMTMDEAVQWLADLTDKMMAKVSPEERARRFREAGKIIASAKKRDRAKPSRSSRVASGRRRTLARG
jgi:hypothetical protein